MVLHTHTAETLPATGDITAVPTLTDAQLVVELADAQRRMNQSRHNRTGLAHQDAKLAVNVLSRETRARGLAVA